MIGMTTRREFLRWAGFAGLGIAATACVPAAPTGTTGEAGEEAVTLLVWDQWSGGGADAGMQELVESFTEANPNITIEREVYSGNEQLRDLLKTALGAGTGPDLMYYDLGAFALQVLVNANQLMPLDDAYEQYGWDQKIFDFAQQWCTLEGKRYAIPHELEFEPVYFNKTAYDELGLQVPETHAEFTANCVATKEAGYIPITIGNAGRGELRHTFGFPLNNLVGKAGMDDITLCGASWDRPEVLEAINIICVDYLEQGFYPPDPNAIPGQDANNLFFTGDAIHKLTGTWWVGTVLEAETEFEPDIYLYPSINGSEVLPQAWLGSGYQVPKDSVDPDAAFKFIDFLYSDAAVPVWVETVSVVPPMPFDAESLNLSALMKKVLSILRSPDQKFGWMPAGFSPPGVYDMMNAGFQQILAGEKTPEQQMLDLQEQWQSAIDGGQYGLKC